MSAARPWRARADGVEIVIRVTPRAAREALLPGTAGHFAARLSAPPVEGAANAALVTLVARHFGVARGRVTLVSGATGRLKCVAVAGDSVALEQIAARLYGSAP